VGDELNGDLLSHGLNGLGLALSAAEQRRLLAYVDLIAKWNKVYNLTAIRDPERMVVEHLLDSLAILPHIQLPRILDIGSGAGLPGIPLAIACPDSNVTLLDSNHKKCAFLQQALIELSLRNVVVACERIEAFSAPGRFTTVVSRAFSDTQHFARVGSAHLAPRGVLLAMKGLHPHEEIAQLPGSIKLLSVQPLSVPGLSAHRHVVVMTRA